MNARIRMTLALISFLAILQAGLVSADNAVLQKKLKRDVVLKLENVTIAEALERIGQEAGITIELSDEAIWELPEGAETHLSVTLEGQLAESLEQMLNTFFMRYAVGSDAVVIYPRSELKHIMGRPTPETLKLLRNIYTNSMHIRGDEKAMQKMAHAVVNQLAGENVSLFPGDTLKYIARTMGQMSGGSPDGATIFLAPILDGVVDTIARDRGRWVVCAPEWPHQIAQIKIISQRDYNKIMLDRLIDLSFEEETGLTILKNLANTADITLDLAGDDLVWLERRVSIEALNIRVEEALQRVVAALGGRVTTQRVGSDGIRYSVQKKPGPSPEALAAQARARSEAEARAAAAARRHSGGGDAPAESVASSGQYVGKISIPMDGGRYFIEFMLRESDLTDELRRLRAERIKEILKTASASTEAQETPAP